MTEPDLILGTRGSPLALKQARDVQAMLADRAGFVVEIRVVKTTGDLRTDRAFKEIGAKGLFTKELDEALLAGSIDLAVHSMKDLPSLLPDGLTLAAVPQAVDPRDALVGPAGTTLAGLPAGARVGTSSLRRRALVRLHRPDVAIDECRGNVDTRLAKLAAGEFDAILLAHAGLHRLGLADRISELLDPVAFPPAAGQGMIAAVCRADDARVQAALAKIHDAASGARAAAERRFLAAMDGGCSVPLGCYVERKPWGVAMHGFLADFAPPDLLRGEIRCEAEAPDAAAAAEKLIALMDARGAAGVIARMKGL